MQVTDYAEEKEILSTSTDLEDAIATIRNKQVRGDTPWSKLQAD